MAPDVFTLVFTSRLSRDAVLAYIFVGTHLLPHDRPPSLPPQHYGSSGCSGSSTRACRMLCVPAWLSSRLDREACLAAIAAEFKRLGEPLRGEYMSPEQVIAHVSAILAAEQTLPDPKHGEPKAGPSHGKGSGPPATDKEAPEAGAETETHQVWYTANSTDDGDWVLNAWNIATNELVSSATLPPLHEVSDVEGAAYEIIVQDGYAYAWAPGSGEGLLCSEFLEEHASSGAGAATGPAAAPKAKAMPGMTSIAEPATTGPSLSLSCSVARALRAPALGAAFFSWVAVDTNVDSLLRPGSGAAARAALG